jgi:hypothetical protein
MFHAGNPAVTSPVKVYVMSTFPFHGYRCFAVAPVIVGFARTYITAVTAASNSMIRLFILHAFP